MSEFWAKYKHPKWQEKRLRIMESSGFRCVECWDDQTTLNVHHTYYEKGKEPWEYPDDSLRCLCDDCHSKHDDLRREIARQIGKLPLGMLQFILGFVRGIEMRLEPDTHHPIETGEIATGMLLAWEISRVPTRQLNEIASTLHSVTGHVVDAVSEAHHNLVANQGVD